ncbi:MAG: DUF4224 domain-containing protein [Castellaniella sp.]|nr:DUF4224 domain-containing protein [Castellaniella sp.]
MPGNLYLTPAELVGLTGYKTRPGVSKWLDQNGWPSAGCGKDGWPRVLREYHDARMMGLAPARKKATATEPAWSVS